MRIKMGDKEQKDIVKAAIYMVRLKFAKEISEWARENSENGYVDAEELLAALCQMTE
jgi:hypothetical protein